MKLARLWDPARIVEIVKSAARTMDVMPDRATVSYYDWRRARVAYPSFCIAVMPERTPLEFSAALCEPATMMCWRIEVTYERDQEPGTVRLFVPGEQRP